MPTYNCRPKRNAHRRLVASYLLFFTFAEPFITAFLHNNHDAFKSRRLDHSYFPLKEASGSIQLQDPILLDCSNQDDGWSFLLPIFPLRKRVRFPTDTLMLNLYEERYLAMSECILCKEKDFTPQLDLELPSSTQPIKSLPAPFFGAIYSSDKPQLITQGGMAPITPMLSVGDVGVLCLVQDWMDGMIPTRQSSTNDSGDDTQTSNDKVDNTFRRRIRLNAVAVARFRIVKVVQESPFILVEAQTLTDDSTLDYDAQQMEGLETELCRVLQQDDSTPQAKTTNGDVVTALSTTNSLDAVDSICSMIKYSGDQQQGTELLSFLTVSTLTDGSSTASPEDLSSMLETQSLQNRMDILKFYKQW